MSLRKRGFVFEKEVVFEKEGLCLRKRGCV